MYTIITLITVYRWAHATASFVHYHHFDDTREFGYPYV